MPGQPQELPEIPERTHLRDVIDSFGQVAITVNALINQLPTVMRVCWKALTPKPTKVDMNRLETSLC